MNQSVLALSPPALRRVEMILCGAVLALLTFGVVMLCSTSSFYAQDRFGDAYFLFKRQLLWLGIGLVACVAATRLDYHLYRRLVWWILGLAAVALVAVLLFGTVRNGARRWLILGPISLQPSEFAKLGLVVFLAFWFENVHRRAKSRLGCQIRHPWWGFGLPLLVTAVLAALILKQPDTGTALLFFVVTVILMWVAGTNRLWLGGFVALSLLAGAVLLVGILKFGWLQDHYQVKRVIVWWNGDDPLGINFQQTQALYAFGSGGPAGVGLGESRQKMFYLPEAHTDFIFPIIGEELGLAGTMGVVAAFAVIVTCAGLMAMASVDLFGLLLGTGIVALFALQALINIAVVTNSIPNKGMPLPFISYGGSNIVVLLASIGVLLSICRRAHSHMTGRYLDPRKEAHPVAAGAAV